MKNDYRKEAYYNAIISGACQVIIIILGFLVPRLFISNYGSNVNGLLGTISQIFTYVALIESGIGAATQNALYKPIAASDNKRICEILTASKKYYHKVTVYYALVVAGMAFALPFVIKTDVDYWTIVGIVIFEGASGVVNFWFLEHWKMLMAAEGKQHVIARIDLVSRVLSYLVKIILAYMMVNIVFIQAGYFVVALVALFLYRRYIKKQYAWVHYTDADESIPELKDRNSYVVNDVAWTVFSSTDMVLISIIFNTAYASVYSVYNMVYNALTALMNSIYNSVAYVLGQNYHKDIELYKKLHDSYELVFIIEISALMSCCSVLMIPFISFYTRGVSDINYIYKFFPLLFGLVQILSWDRYVSGNLLLVDGKAKRAASYSVVEAILNVTFSILLSLIIGIYGIIIATVVALLYKVIRLTYDANHMILKRSSSGTVKRILCNLFVYLSIEVFSWIKPISVNSIAEFILAGVLTVIAVGLYYFGANMLVNLPTMKTIYSLLRKRK